MYFLVSQRLPEAHFRQAGYSTLRTVFYRNGVCRMRSSFLKRYLRLSPTARLQLIRLGFLHSVKTHSRSAVLGSAMGIPDDANPLNRCLPAEVVTRTIRGKLYKVLEDGWSLFESDKFR